MKYIIEHTVYYKIKAVCWTTKIGAGVHVFIWGLLLFSLKFGIL